MLGTAHASFVQAGDPLGLGHRVTVDKRPVAAYAACGLLCVRARLSEAGLLFLPIRVFDTATRGLPRCSRVLGPCPLAASAWCIVPAPARSFARTYAFYAHHAPLPFVPGARACVVAVQRAHAVRRVAIAMLALYRALCALHGVRYVRRARAGPAVAARSALCGMLSGAHLTVGRTILGYGLLVSLRRPGIPR